MLHDFRWIEWNVEKVEKQVVYLIDPDGAIFVIHAMPLTTRRRRGSR